MSVMVIMVVLVILVIIFMETNAGTRGGNGQMVMIDHGYGIVMIMLWCGWSGQ